MKKSHLVPLLLLLLTIGYGVHRSGKDTLRMLMGHEQHAFLKTASIGSEIPALTVSEPMENLEPKPEVVFPSKEKLKPIPAPRKKVASTGGVETFTTGNYRMEQVTASTQELALGFDAGFSYLLPVVRYQLGLSNSFALGIFGTYMKGLSGPDVTVGGLGLTGTYYTDGRLFRGAFVEAGVAYYDIQARNFFRSSSANPWSFSGSIGWKGQMAPGITAAVSGGLQYAVNGNRDIKDITFNGLMPLIKFSIGTDF